MSCWRPNESLEIWRIAGDLKSCWRPEELPETWRVGCLKSCWKPEELLETWRVKGHKSCCCWRHEEPEAWRVAGDLESWRLDKPCDFCCIKQDEWYNSFPGQNATFSQVYTPIVQVSNLHLAGVRKVIWGVFPEDLRLDTTLSGFQSQISGTASRHLSHWVSDDMNIIFFTQSYQMYEIINQD